MASMWKKLMKNVDLDEQTSFLDHVYLGCSQRECKPQEIIIEECTKVFESFISAGTVEKLPRCRKASDMKRHARNCVERCCELTNKKDRAVLHSPCLDDYQFKQKELESMGEVSHVRSQIVLSCLYLARIGRPDILWAINKTSSIRRKMDESM